MSIYERGLRARLAYLTAHQGRPRTETTRLALAHAIGRAEAQLAQCKALECRELLTVLRALAGRK